MPVDLVEGEVGGLGAVEESRAGKAEGSSRRGFVVVGLEVPVFRAEA